MQSFRPVSLFQDFFFFLLFKLFLCFFAIANFVLITNTVCIQASGFQEKFQSLCTLVEEL